MVVLSVLIFPVPPAMDNLVASSLQDNIVKTRMNNVAHT